MEAVDVARIRTQVRLAELALLGLVAENQSIVDGDPQLDGQLDKAMEHLEYAQLDLTTIINKLDAGKPPRERAVQ